MACIAGMHKQGVVCGKWRGKIRKPGDFFRFPKPKNPMHTLESYRLTYLRSVLAPALSNLFFLHDSQELLKFYERTQQSFHHATSDLQSSDRMRKCVCVCVRACAR